MAFFYIECSINPEEMLRLVNLLRVYTLIYYAYISETESEVRILYVFFRLLNVVAKLTA